MFIGKGNNMAKIWFRVGMEADVTEKELEDLRESKNRYELMERIIESATLSGETYILGKDCGGVDDYDNPEKEINFLF